MDNAELDEFKYLIHTRLSRECVADMDIRVMADIVSQQLMVVWTRKMWGEDVGKLSITYPADWWQAFKERWFPTWALGRWPVRYETREADVKCVYPDFHPALPDETHTFLVG